MRKNSTLVALYDIKTLRNQPFIDYLIKKGHLFNCVNEINLILDHFEVWYYQFLENENTGN